MQESCFSIRSFLVSIWLLGTFFGRDIIAIYCDHKPTKAAWMDFVEGNWKHTVIYTHTRTHLHTYIMFVCIFVCVWVCLTSNKAIENWHYLLCIYATSQLYWRIISRPTKITTWDDVLTKCSKAVPKYGCSPMTERCRRYF